MQDLTLTVGSLLQKSHTATLLTQAQAGQMPQILQTLSYIVISTGVHP